MGLEHKESCRPAFKDLTILTAVAIYVLETIISTVSTGQNRHTYHASTTQEIDTSL